MEGSDFLQSKKEIRVVNGKALINTLVRAGIYQFFRTSVLFISYY